MINGIAGVAMTMLLLALCVAVSQAAEQTPSRYQRYTIRPVGYGHVSLDDGMFRRLFDEVSEYYLRIPNDDMLKPYRQRAGLPAPGGDMGGVYVGHDPFGQFLSGYARMYAITGRREFREKALALMHGWGETLADDGYFYSAAKPHLAPYSYDKMVCGLVDIHQFIGDAPEALRLLDRITDWAETHLDRQRRIGDTVSPEGGEWYTLSENLYRAYLATGNERYRRFGQVWEYTEYWNYFDTATPSIPFHERWYHAYSHVNTFSGLGTAWQITGDAKYLRQLRHAHDYVRAHQCWATGGFGANEALMPREEMHKALMHAVNHFETQCGSWAVVKLTKALLCATGEARYGDWMEQVLINGVGASIPMSGDGRVFYYSEYSPGGAIKRNITAAWPCCSGTRSQVVPEVHDLVYFQDADAVYVNLYTPSTLRTQIRGREVTVRQRTAFPESDTTALTFELARPLAFAVRLRAPEWLKSPAEVMINGEAVDARVNEKGWIEISRRWSSRDTLQVRLPMGFGVNRLMSEQPYPAAITYGPTVLATRLLDANPATVIELDKLAKGLQPIPGEPLAWKWRDDPNVQVRPFYAFPEGQRYVLYLDPSRTLNYVSYRAARFSDGWTDFGGWKTASEAGQWAEYDFTGTGLRLHYFRYDDSGQVDLFVDGTQVGTLDQYGPNRGEAAIHTLSGLSDGRHTLRVVVRGDRSSASKGTFTNIAAFEMVAP